jgi:hypothetical protein
MSFGGFWTPERIQERLHAAEAYLREARKNHGAIRTRWQAQVQVTKPNSGSWRAVRGESLIVTFPEVVDFWDCWRDLKRWLTLWRPARRRTAASSAAVAQAWELLERASRDLKL